MYWVCRHTLPVAMQRLKIFWWSYSRNFLQKRGLNDGEVLRPQISRASKKLIKWVREIYLYALVWCMHFEWQCGQPKQPNACMSASYFLQLVFPIHLYNFTSHHRKKSILFKGGCINWLGKCSFYSLTKAMWTPVLCIRNRPSFQKYGGRKWGVEERKKMPVFKLEALLNWWAPGVELFCREIICIMGKWLKLELRTLLLWGQSVSEVEEENSYLIEDQYQGALRGRCITVICSLASCHLPISSAKQFTNNLSDVRCWSVLMNLLLKRLHRNCSVFIRLMNLTQCNIFQPTYYDKKKDDWLENWNSAKYNFWTHCIFRNSGKL